MMSPLIWRLTGLVIALIAPIDMACSQTGAATETSSILERASLPDGHAGPRASLRNHGVNLDLWLTDLPQGAVSGKDDRGWQYGSRGDIVATVDGVKLGLWDGLFVNAHAGLAYGKNANQVGVGAPLPVSAADKDASIVLTQRFSEHAALHAGKFNMRDAAERMRLVGGGGDGTFLGLAAPREDMTPPNLLGGSLAINNKPVDVTLLVYDPRNAQDWDVISNPFSGGMTTGAALSSPVTIAGRNGTYGFKATYTTRYGSSLGDAPALLGAQGADPLIETKQGSWSAGASFQQYIVQSPVRPGEGWGAVGQVFVSDGSLNATGWRVHGGLGGTGFLPGRALDRWGIAYFYRSVSAVPVDGLASKSFSLREKPGLKTYYNVAVTRSCLLTADVQFTRQDVADYQVSVIGALRAQLKF